MEISLANGVLHVGPTQGVPLEDVCAFASRQNPKRGFLFVSKVLGKHLPVAPSTVLEYQAMLARRLSELSLAPGAHFMLGFAETATALGAGVFEAYRQTRGNSADELAYAQTTRFLFEGRELAFTFAEEHSHAPLHLLYRSETHPGIERYASTLTLVDDELSTGTTCLNFIREFSAINSSLKSVVLVSLISWMSPERKRVLQEAFPKLVIHFVSLMDGSFEYVPCPGRPVPVLPAVEGTACPKNKVIPHSFGRFGAPDVSWRFEAVSKSLALSKSRPVAVVADGEYMYPALLFARHLEQQGFAVTFQATTRSPVLPGHAIQHSLEFYDHYGEGIRNYLHNPPSADTQVLFCHEAVGTTLHLLEQLSAQAIPYSAFLDM